MTSGAESVDRAAMEWLVRVQDPAFDSWDEWEAWLTRAPEHAAAYWRLADVDAELVESSSPAPPAIASPGQKPRPTPSLRRLARRPWFAAGIAAAFALVCGLAWLTIRSPQVVIETDAGETRSVVLTDGTLVHLAGASRLATGSDDRRVRLEAGRALFEVADDPHRPFTVLVDRAEIVDLGTVFDVTRLENGVRVAVSEGVVRYDGMGRSEQLEAGEALLATGMRLQRSRIDPAEVPGWRKGRLSYRQESYAIVCGDLQRALGWRVEVAPSLAARPFTGSLDTTGARSAVKARVESLLGVSVVDDGDGWRLNPVEPA